ncbi:hypothetical protein ACTIVE_0249 [Actinomadura verrucosospora]|uniref:Uncharacterized protein n=1 Tax=Actinomadura verrucosospora TaxID=46165 RepID=A0A7D3VND7_ACTVE|nr:hypothetical protein ACTIVE_0249 [Actinomadura verrucosospora]
MPGSARTASNNSGNPPSRSRIGNRARQPASPSPDQVPGHLWHPRGGRLGVGAQNADPAAVVFDDRQHARKSHANNASPWERRNPVHVVAGRSGAGSTPASLRTHQAKYPQLVQPRRHKRTVHRSEPAPSYRPASAPARRSSSRGDRLTAACPRDWSSHAREPTPLH